MAEPRLDLRQLRAFQTAVDAGSLTAAAQRLHLTQPSLSAAIGKLEAQLGVALLIRTSRGVEPTAAGRYLLDASTRIFGEVEETERALAGFGAGTRGTLTIAAVPALLWQRVPRLLAGLARIAPDVEARLIDPPPWTALDMLQQGTADAAAILVSRPEQVAERMQGSFSVTDWGTVPLVALSPIGTFPGESISAVEIAKHPLLVPRRTPALASLPEAIDDYLESHGVVPHALRSVETIQTMLPLVAAGLGVALIPDPEGPIRGGVDLHRLAPAPDPLRALVVTRAGERRSASLSRLLEVVEETADGWTAVSSE
ncbi:LysR family transcriptional regulator [Salinibacterium sp. ZJ77]|uniref:LysR family transcriptional regulator n=1 Tax=Salinibacterium sp. ZJ77 TaxID=2708337 RepID=UPI00142323C4|nr:LysR family transcriptional regulator [Salinibacterium sp. ZJ77]